MAVKRWNGSAWITYAGADTSSGFQTTDGRVGTKVWVGSVTPSNASDGDIWIDNDTTTNTIPVTAFDAKGDLLVGNGADTYLRLASGTAGQALKVNSTATGLEWSDAVKLIDSRVFTASTTYTKPTGAKVFLIEMWGAGGGGGSGRASVGSYPDYGGAGGSGGLYSRVYASESEFSSSITVTVGTGGAGGFGVSSGTPTNGLAGSNGGYSAFGNFTVGGGTGGIGGIDGAASNHTHSFFPNSNGIPSTSAVNGMPISGGAGSATGASGGRGFQSGGGGGHGGGVDSKGSLQSATAGGSSTNVISDIYTVSAGVPYVAYGGGGAANTAGSSSTATAIGGAGGGGGSGTASSKTDATNGGTGGVPGGGGGGGGGLYAGVTSGSGGTGGRGEVRIWVYG